MYSTTILTGSDKGSHQYNYHWCACKWDLCNTPDLIGPPFKCGTGTHKQNWFWCKDPPGPFGYTTQLPRRESKTKSKELDESG